MKVIFLFGGLPHYLNKVLNKIHADHDIEVVVIAPQGSSSTFGSGVHQTEQGITFKVIRLKEYKTWYGKPFFKDFYKTVAEQQPAIIVSGWPYFLAYVLNPLLLIRLKNKRITLIGREIPFTVPGYHESFNDFDLRCVPSQKNELIFKSKLVFNLLKWMRKYLYSAVFEKALLYTEQGIDIIHSYGMKKENITVTYNSPDTEEIIRTIGEVRTKFPELVKKQHRLLHVGRLVKWKNVDLIIKATNVLKSKYQDIELIIIGKGEEEENLKTLVKSLGLDAHVSFPGAIYEGESQTMEFLKSGVYILAGMGGLSINEAMAHGLPVICSVADGTEKQLVFDGENGYYFEDGNVESLIEAIEKLWASDTISMGNKSFEIIRNRINIEFVSDQFIKAFKH